MAKPEKSKKDNKHFFKDFKAELKKVIWPTPKQLANNTVAVITIVLITAAIVFVLDFAFEALNTYGINRLKNAVETTSEENSENNNNSDNNNSAVEGESNTTNTNTQTDNSNDSNSENNVIADNGNETNNTNNNVEE